MPVTEHFFDYSASDRKGARRCYKESVHHISNIWLI